MVPDRKTSGLCIKILLSTKDKISFPQDIIKKVCHFDIPCILANWCSIEDETFKNLNVIHANPAAPTDLHLKEKYFDGLDEKGLGTILVGVRKDEFL